MAERRLTRHCLFFPCLLLLYLGGAVARIHQLQLKGETRAYVHVTSFGFYINGSLHAKVSVRPGGSPLAEQESRPIRMSLTRSRSGEILSSVGQESDACILNNNWTDSMTIVINVTQKRVQFKSSLENLSVSSGLAIELQQGSLDQKLQSNNSPPATSQKNEQKDAAAEVKPGIQTRSARDTPLISKASGAQGPGWKEGEMSLDVKNNAFNFSFSVVIGPKEEGLYNLNFYNCYSLRSRRQPYDLTVEIIEQNPGGYLSAAEIPLIKLYLLASGCFFTAAVIWICILLRNRHSVFKIHWLMAALTLTKSFSLLFHSINYYVINTKGHPIEGLAVMYYIAHVLKGALLFITIVLIGTGWAFIKYILSDKEKKIFIIVLPLQVLANVAYIIIESSEKGSSDYALWKQILFLVDLICCGAILFPVIWSIRHLQEASCTDGKAAVNLAKLKLFRHYYVMIVCYIYFTRIIAILLQVIVPFQWQWLYQLLVEGSTFTFFVLTGYNFRPASDNPYLQLPQEEEEDIQMDEVVTSSGVLDGVSRVKKVSNGRESSA